MASARQFHCLPLIPSSYKLPLSPKNPPTNQNVELSLFSEIFVFLYHKYSLQQDVKNNNQPFKSYL